MKFLMFIALLFLMMAAAPDHADASRNQTDLVSLVQLIGNPNQYDGKEVAVVGFLRLEFEGNELYLSRQDYRHAITKNGIWVNLASDLRTQAEQLNMRYVLVVGVFNAENNGHMSSASGSIDAVRAVVWPISRPLTK